MFKTIVLAGAAVLLPWIGNADVSSHTVKENMISDLDTIRNSFRVEYAPAQWKHQYFGWDLDTAIDIAKQEVHNFHLVSVKNYQEVVKTFFRSTRDYHVGVYFYSTEYASLPFAIKGAQGRFFITSVDYDRLDPSAFPMNAGDELLQFEGRRIADAVAEYQQAEYGSSGEGTDRSLAEMMLTFRSGIRGSIVPNGPIVVQVRSVVDGGIRSYELIWDYSPEEVQNDAIFKHLKKPRLALKEILRDKKMVASVYKSLLKHKCKDCRLQFDLGDKYSFIPDLGEKIWESDPDGTFYAYIYLAGNGNSIGYVRIPSYEGDEYDAMDFSAIIDTFQNNTDALVIDQVYNPGGSVFYLYALASMLTDQPLATPRHHYKLTQADVYEAVQSIPELELISSDEEAASVLGNTLDGYPVNYQLAQFVLSYYRFILDRWNSGKTFTDPYWLLGVDQINPSPLVQYTKPILLLVNELDFSGADFFPAIMQDNGRAIILGTKTAGAGGIVIDNSYPNQFGVAQYSYTATIAERANGQPIENLGVTPDIVYALTPDDFQNGFQEYVEAVQGAVSNLLP